MPVPLTTYIDPEHYALLRERHASLNLTNAELMRYLAFLGCGYAKEKAVIMAKIKPLSMERGKEVLV